MRAVGVLGGLGPQATMLFESLVHAEAQRVVPQNVNSGYPPMSVIYFRGVPFVVNADGTAEVPLRPSSPFLAAAAELGRTADFLVVTSNFLHIFQAEIERAAGRAMLSMIDLALAQVSQCGWKRVGVLGFRDPFVYTERLRADGIVIETVAAEQRAQLDIAIQAVMEGRADAGSVRAAEAALQELRQRGVDGTILGCTEIPILLDHPAADSDLIDPLPLLAEATVRHSLE